MTIRLVYSPDRIEHIARHDVTVDEVREVLASRHLRVGLEGKKLGFVDGPSSGVS